MFVLLLLLLISEIFRFLVVVFGVSARVVRCRRRDVPHSFRLLLLWRRRDPIVAVVLLLLLLLVLVVTETRLLLRRLWCVFYRIDRRGFAFFSLFFFRVAVERKKEIVLVFV